MLCVNCRNVKSVLPHVQKCASFGMMRSLHTTLSCRTDDKRQRMKNSTVFIPLSPDEEYQYLYKSKIPTMHFQKSLYRLPIPELSDTCGRYINSQKAILSSEEFRVTENVANQFLKDVGYHLNQELKKTDEANKHTSYISELWFDMYLSDRVPVVLNYNPFLSFWPEERSGYDDPVLRATNMLISTMRFMRTLRDQALLPLVYHLDSSKSDTKIFWHFVRWMPSLLRSLAAYSMKAFPLDMSQFGNLFNSTRIPVVGKDILKCDPSARHMLFMKNGNFYVFDIFDNDGNLLPPSHIHACVSYIANDPTPAPEHSIAILSSESRDTWARCRAELIEAGNEEQLNAIDTAAFNIVLDDAKTNMDPEKAYRTFLYGNGKNRWYDKSFSLIFTADGQAALNFEHAWGDGVAVMSYANHMIDDVKEKVCVHPSSTPANIDASQYVRKLNFNLTSGLKAAIDRAIRTFEASTNALQVHILDSDVFGKRFCKKNSVSPDSMMQLGLQTAYYLQHGQTVATYESCSTAAFRHGRTETIRPATTDTVAFTKAVTSPQPPSNSELKNLILKCSKVHSKLTKEAAMGQGFDRHLFALRKLAEASRNRMPDLYRDPAYSKMNHNIISTSTLPSDDIHFGGFAPVVKDGFGIGYQIQQDRLGIVVSSYPPYRDGAGFIECADKAYEIIYDILSKE